MKDRPHLTKNHKGDNVIHVDFGALSRPQGELRPKSKEVFSDAQGLEQGEGLSKRELTSCDELGDRHQRDPIRQEPEPLRPADPCLSLYRRREVAALFSVTEGRLRYWQKTELIVPSVIRDGQAYYTFQDLVSVRTVKELLAKGISARRVRSLVESLRSTIPDLQRPLTEMRIVTDGQDIAVRDESGSFEPTSGQRLLDFRGG